MADLAKIVEDLSSLTVLEAAELSKMLEEKWGVSAAAPVAVAAAGGAGNSVMAAAEANNGKVIGVDIDQSAESTTVITSAMKGLGISVYNALADYYAGSFKGGVSVSLGVDVDGVSLPSDFSRFATFTEADYTAIYEKLVADTDGVRSNIKKDTDVASAKELPVTNVTVEVIE